MPKPWLVLSQGSVKMLLGFVALAVVTGSIMTYGLYGRIQKTEHRVQQLQAENSVITTRHMQLRAARAQLSSKSHILALVEKRLRLYEPGKGQVHRM